MKTQKNASFAPVLRVNFSLLYSFAVTTGRKAMTIVLSFMFFAKPFSFQ